MNAPQRLPSPLTAKLLRLVAGAMVIEDQAHGALSRWRPTGQQRETWRAVMQERRLVVLKARQLGVSTALCLHDLMLCLTRPGITVAIIADTQDRAKGLLKKCANFAKQMPCEIVESNTQTLSVRGGGGPPSSIVALTAGSSLGRESRAGRGGTLHHVHSTETSFHAGGGGPALAAVTAALVPSGSIVLESTAHPGGTAFREAARSSEWEQLFFGVETNPAYVADPRSLSDVEWMVLQEKYSFTSRAHAAWWHQRLMTDFGGARERCLREYPVTAEHPWMVAEGRWFDAWPGALPTLYTMPTGLQVHEQPDPGQRYSVAVDVAAGKGKDKSVVVVQDWRGDIAASWSSNLATLETIRLVIVEAQSQFTVAHAFVEENGVGHGLAQMHIPSIRPVTTTKTSKHLGLEKVKYHAWRALPAAMKPEVEGLYIQDGEFHGPKDYAMALGIGLLYSSSLPSPRPVYDATQFQRKSQPRRGRFGTYG